MITDENMGPEKDKPLSTDLVELVNELLGQLHVTLRVRDVKDINAAVFVTLFEGLSGEPLQDVIRQPKSREDEIHNCQAVIDSLALDVLSTSLSHISGEAVVQGNHIAVKNLLDVFCWLQEYMLNRIESDASTDNDEDETTEKEDPDMVTPEVIDSILDAELRNSRGYSDHSLSDAQRLHQRESKSTSYRESTNNTTDLIALGKVSGDDQFSKMSPEKTEDLIALGDSRYTRTGLAIHPERLPTEAWAPSTAPAYSLGPGAHTDRLATTALSGDHRAQVLSNGHAAGSRLAMTVPAEGYPGALSVNGHASHRQVTTASSYPYTGASHVKGHDVGPRVPGQTDATRMVQTNASGWRDTSYQSDTRDRERRSPGTTPSTRIVNKSQSVMNEAYRLGSLVSQGHLNTSGASSVSEPKPVISTKVSSGVTGSQYDDLGVRPCPTSLSASLPIPQSSRADPIQHNFTHHLYHHYERSTDRPARPGSRPTDAFTSSLPVSSSLLVEQPDHPSNAYRKPGRLNATMPYRTPASPQAYRSGPVPARAHSYESLHTLVQDTVAMSRDAILHRPLRDTATSPTRPDVTAISNGMQGTRTSSRPTQEEQSQPSALRSPGREEKGRRKVSFLTSRSSDDLTTSRETSSTMTGSFNKADAMDLPVQSSLRKYYQSSNVAPSQSASGGRHTSGAYKPLTTGKSKPQTRKPRKSPAKAKTKPIAHELAPRQQTDTRASTFRDYLDKYYGKDYRPDILKDEYTSEGELSQHSDSAVDYGDPRSRVSYSECSADEDTSQDVEAELEKYRKKLRKNVRFDDILDSSAPGQMGSIRRKLQAEDKRSRVKTEFLDKMYSLGLDDFEEETQLKLAQLRRGAKQKEKEYKKKVLTGPKTSRSKPRKKYQASVTPRTRQKKRSSVVKPRRRSASASPALGRKSTLRLGDEELLGMLLEEFPFLHLSTETLHDLWRKSALQIDQLSRSQHEAKQKKTKAQAQIEEAERRQKILLDMMRKELTHQQRLKDIKERQQQQQSVKARIRDRRQQSARARRYYDEYQVQMRSKMLKKRTKEELIFKKLFKDALEIQKDRMRDLRKYTKEERERRAARQQNEIESLENYYRDQFAMLAESITKEREDLSVREKGQAEVLDKMKKELRQKMERDIRDFQEQLYRDEDEAYWRQLDADRLKQQLQLARYQVKV